MDELVAIRSEELSAKIHPRGAELWSLRDVDGRELMTDADPAWWTGHAPLLFPIVGRLRNDSYRVDGRIYTLPQHGFARHCQFSLVNSNEGHALFRLEADAETLAIYPFDFRLDVDFELKATALNMTVTVVNTGKVDMPFSIGFHPAFAWPLPYGADADHHRILFEKAEPAPIRRIGGEPGLIAMERQATPVHGRELYPKPEMFSDDAMIWDDLQSRSLRWGAEGGPQLRIDFPDTPWLGVWQKPGAHYLCIEPWAGMADPTGFSGDIWEKPGILRLPASEAYSFRLNVTLEKN